LGILETEMRWDGFVGREQVTEEENGVFLCAFVGNEDAVEMVFFFILRKKKLII
jgi:hypothetical protein